MFRNPLQVLASVCLLFVLSRQVGCYNEPDLTPVYKAYNDYVAQGGTEPFWYSIKVTPRGGGKPVVKTFYLNVPSPSAYSPPPAPRKNYRSPPPPPPPPRQSYRQPPRQRYNQPQRSYNRYPPPAPRYNNSPPPPTGPSDGDACTPGAFTCSGAVILQCDEENRFITQKCGPGTVCHDAGNNNVYCDFPPRN